MLRFRLALALWGCLSGIAVSSQAAEVWVIGKGGESWAARASVAAGVDMTDPKVLRPAVFTFADNITQAIEWVNVPTEDFVAEGKGHIWDNAAVTSVDSNATSTLVDADSSTSTGDRFKTFGISQTGRIFFLDLGTSFPANRIAFYPRPQKQDDYIRSFEIAVNDGQSYGSDRTPIYQIVRQVELNRDWLTEVAFPIQLVRFVRLRVLSTNPFELAELEVHGDGFVPRGRYESGLVKLPSPANFGTLAFRATKVRRGADGLLVPEPAAEANVSVQLKNGQDDTPLIYYKIVDLETGREEETTKEAYAGLPEAVRGTIREDLTNWSPWNKAIEADVSGVYTLTTELPGPRSYFQFRLLFEGSSSDAVQVDSLSVTYSSPMAAGVVGEVALRDDPNPASGLVIVPAGIDTTLTYDIRADLGNPPLAGFDGVRVATPTRPHFLQLEIGKPLALVAPDSVREEEGGLMVYFPSHRIERGRNERLRLTFRTSLLLYSTLFEGQLLDTGGRLPQAIPEGDASEEVGTNSLQVLFASGAEKVLNSFEARPPVVTPNGDGRNEQSVFSYVIVHLVQPAATTVAVYDLAGRLVKELFSGELAAGRYEQAWDGTDQDRRRVVPGIYLARVSVETEQGEMVRMRSVQVVY
jgi:hypothetical protein